MCVWFCFMTGNKVINRKDSSHLKPFVASLSFYLILMYFFVFFHSFTSIGRNIDLNNQIWVNVSNIYCCGHKCVNSWILNKAMSQSFFYIPFFLCRFYFTKIINIHSYLWLFTILLNYFLCFRTEKRALNYKWII